MITPNGYPVICMFHQPAMEHAVRKNISRYPGVQLLLSHEVASFVQHDDHVTLEVQDLDAGTASTIEAKWLLACDGANSPVRKACGLQWKSLGYDREWLVVDVKVTGEDRLPTATRQVCDPERPTTMMPLPLGMRRWEFQLRENETAEEMEQLERVWELVENWMPRRDAEIVRAAVYCFHSTIADDFRCNRVFLAGDAAHQTPPFMGQGLCSGLRDVDNLVWKISHIERGLARDSLLDTYCAERRPLTLAAIEHSVKTGQLIDAYAQMQLGGPEPPPELQAYAYGGDAQLPDLSSGLLAGRDSNWIGRLVPQAPAVVEDRHGTLDELVGLHWAVISGKDPREALDDDARSRWEKLGAMFVTIPEPSGAMLALLLEHEVVVARPDRVIFGEGKDHPAL
jgi:3-(3-hydroxy-phenyl)propionate hydroxylase